VGANEDLITNHREITNGRWRLYENWYAFGVRCSLEVFRSANRRYHCELGCCREYSFQSRYTAHSRYQPPLEED
jgi:hypothetical protein